MQTVLVVVVVVVLVVEVVIVVVVVLVLVEGRIGQSAGPDQTLPSGTTLLSEHSDKRAQARLKGHPSDEYQVYQVQLVSLAQRSWHCSSVATSVKMSIKY